MNERYHSSTHTVDYLTHDIPVGILAPSENEEAFLKLFRLLKTIKYPLQIAICDEASGLQNALREYYPKARVQLCQNHYLENTQQRLQVRTNIHWRNISSSFTSSKKRRSVQKYIL